MRHFIYQDEKSHKFWAVEQQGNELHINWGKVGTNGQSQIKSFADAAAAAKAGNDSNLLIVFYVQIMPD
ncbi:WGR domain-containing protein, partial [Escherichia coli]|nr:WGR domain-containing protein [Escherichia coli]